MIKTLIKVGIEGTYLNIIKAIYDKSTGFHKGEKLKAFSLNSGKRQGCPLSAVLFNMLLEVLTIAIRQEKEIRRGIKKAEQKDELSLSLVRTPESQLAAGLSSTGRHWNSPKQIPHIQRQRTSHNEIVGGAQSE